MIKNNKKYLIILIILSGAVAVSLVAMVYFRNKADIYSKPSVIFEGEKSFNISIEDFINRYNKFCKREGTHLKLPSSDGSLQYVYPDEENILTLPTLSIVSADNEYIKNVSLSYDWHSYSEETLSKYQKMCYYSVKLFFPEMPDAKITKLCDNIINIGYENPVDAKARSFSAYFCSGDIEIKTRYALGQSQIIIILPLIQDEILEKSHIYQF